MTKTEIERRILDLEKNLSIISSKNYGRFSDDESKIQSTDTEILNTKNDVSENKENIEMVDGTVSALTEEIIPEINDSAIETSEMVDTIMSDLLPEIMDMIAELSGVTNDE